MLPQFMSRQEGARPSPRGSAQHRFTQLCVLDKDVLPLNEVGNGSENREIDPMVREAQGTYGPISGRRTKFSFLVKSR